MQFCELSTQLVQESRRSTLTDTLLKYNDTLVRSIIREQRELEKLAESLSYTEPPSPALLLYQTAISRNKRCLLAYHGHRVERLVEMYWSVGGALAYMLSNEQVRSKLSPHEVDYLRQYNENVMEYRIEEVDITGNIMKVPRELYVLVKVLKDCGIIETEMGSINFKRGERFLVGRTEIEHLLVLGYLQEL